MFDINLLNDSQRQAVECLFGPVLVVAGAGTGKTRVLTSRVMYLMQEKHLKGWEILALTFTNKAANEMKKRISDNGFDNLRWIGTYSSIALRILKEEVSYLGRNPNFTVIDEEDQLGLIKEIMKVNGVDTKLFTPKKMHGWINKYKAGGFEKIKNEPTYFSKVLNALQMNKEALPYVEAIYRRYQKNLLENNIMDFDDLLILTLEIFDNHPEVTKKWSNKFKYILVDEFQDTNKIQFDILMHLINEDSNIFVVGDPDQTIYTWRGAYSEIFNDYLRSFPQTKKYILDVNYRSTQNILDASNKLIKNNANRIDKELRTPKTGGEHVLIYKGRSVDDESDFIAKEIKNLSKDYQYRDIAILYRSNYLSRNIEGALINHGIPYVIYGGTKFYQRKEIKDLLSYLKLLINPSDEISLKRIINVPRRNIGSTTIDRISEYANQNHISFYEALNTTEYVDWSTNKIEYFFKELEFIKNKVEGLKVSDTVNKIVEILKYNEYLDSVSASPEDYAQRLDNIKELVASIIKFEKEEQEFDIKSYLDKISLYTTAVEEQQTADNVSLMTIHAAKGLEFKVVFVISLNMGVFPKVNFDNKSEYEEERRIAYVALTRAQERLYLTNASGFDVVNQKQLTDSLFLKEVQGKHLREVGKQMVTISDLQQDWFDSGKKIESLYNETTPEINVGDTIIHTMFGEGLVISQNENIIDVIFKSPYGTKTLNSKHKSVKRKF